MEILEQIINMEGFQIIKNVNAVFHKEQCPQINYSVIGKLLPGPKNENEMAHQRQMRIKLF